MSTTLARPGVDTPAGALDPRGLRFAAALTSVVLAAVLLLPAPYGVVALAVQTSVFALGALRGPAASPYGWLFRRTLRPRIGPAAGWEAPEPARFAQGVGLAFAVVGLAALLTGATVVAQVAVGAALVAALLNASVGFCLGCELHLLARRLITR